MPSAEPSSIPSAKPSSVPSTKPSSIPSAKPSSIGFSYKEIFEGLKGIGNHGLWHDPVWIDGKSNSQLHFGFADSGNWCMLLRKKTDTIYSIYPNMTGENYDLLNLKFSYWHKFCS